MDGYAQVTLPVGRVCCILQKMSKPGLSADELKTLSELYPLMPLREVAERMGRSYSSVLWAKHTLGLRKTFGQIVTEKPVDLSEPTLAYIAGLIDGEGTVSIRKFSGKWKPHIRIANTSESLMAWLSSTVVGPGIFIEHRRIHDGRLPFFMFHIPGIGWVALYERLLPYMVIKREQMAALVEFSRLRLGQDRMAPLNERQLWLVSRVRELNIKPLHKLSAAKS
jgi:hypothetical protein